VSFCPAREARLASTFPLTILSVFQASNTSIPFPGSAPESRARPSVVLLTFRCPSPDKLLKDARYLIPFVFHTISPLPVGRPVCSCRLLRCSRSAGIKDYGFALCPLLPYDLVHSPSYSIKLFFGSLRYLPDMSLIPSLPPLGHWMRSFVSSRPFLSLHLLLGGPLDRLSAHFSPLVILFGEELFPMPSRRSSSATLKIPLLLLDSMSTLSRFSPTVNFPRARKIFFCSAPLEAPFSSGK